jgi:hypothetical protein
MLLGHSSLEIVQTYAKRAKMDAKDVYRKQVRLITDGYVDIAQAHRMGGPVDNNSPQN